MVGATIREIVDDALAIIGEVSGPGVEQFSDDIMFADAIRAFNMMFKKYTWEQYIDWFQITLDGVNGIMTTPGIFANVMDYEDFIAVHREGESKPIPVLNKRVNPTTITGNQAVCWTSISSGSIAFESYRLQFYPKTAIGNLSVLAKVYPRPRTNSSAILPWSWDDFLHMDRDMLAAGTAFYSLSRDDINGSAADVQRNMMEMRYRDIMDQLGSRGISLNSGSPPIPDQWFSV